MWFVCWSRDISGHRKSQRGGRASSHITSPHRLASWRPGHLHFKHFRHVLGILGFGATSLAQRLVLQAAQPNPIRMSRWPPWSTVALLFGQPQKAPLFCPLFDPQFSPVLPDLGGRGRRCRGSASPPSPGISVPHTHQAAHEQGGTMVQRVRPEAEPEGDQRPLVFCVWFVGSDVSGQTSRLPAYHPASV